MIRFELFGFMVDSITKENSFFFEEENCENSSSKMYFEYIEEIIKNHRLILNTRKQKVKNCVSHFIWTLKSKTILF